MYLQLNFVADDCPISKGYSFFISNPPMLWLAKKNQKLITYGCLYMCQRPTLSTFFSSPNQTLLRHQYTLCQTLHQSSLLFVSFGKKSEKNMQTYCFFHQTRVIACFQWKALWFNTSVPSKDLSEIPYFPDFIMRSGCLIPLYVL